MADSVHCIPVGCSLSSDVKKNALFYLLLAILHIGCGTLKESVSHGLTNGVYRYKSADHPKSTVYVQVEEKYLELYPASTKKGTFDTTNILVVPMNEEVNAPIGKGLRLSKQGWDLDLITVVFKYRFHTPSLPQQFSSHLNGGLYFGRKWESFRFQNSVNRIGRIKKNIQYKTLDLGFMVGLGSTPMNASVTQNQIQTEYDGLVFQKGIAVFGGVSQFTFGFGLGFDTLLDQNRKVWIYQEKPWIGLMVGINLTE